MRKMRKSLVAAATFALVLSTGSIALGDGASENISSIEAGVSPNGQKADRFKAATLTTQVQTFDADEGPFKIPDKAAEQVFLDFDDDIKFNTRGVPSCGGAGGNDLDDATTDQAVDVCKNSLVGSGQALALVPAAPPAPPVVPVELTVTSINGQTSVPGPPCVAPADNQGGPEGCDYIGGNPTIVLHAYNQGLAFITTVAGEIQDSPNLSEDYGNRLAVTDAPDTAGDQGALILFGSTVGKKSVKQRKNRRNRVFQYVTARCEDDSALAGNKEYDFAGRWVYDDGTVDTDTNKQKCGDFDAPPLRK